MLLRAAGGWEGTVGGCDCLELESCGLFSCVRIATAAATAGALISLGVWFAGRPQLFVRLSF